LYNDGTICDMNALDGHTKIRDGAPPFLVMHLYGGSTPLYYPERRIDVLALGRKKH
jgi:hypothetical protein